MEFIRYRVKNMESFKDGNILGGRFLKPNEIIVVTKQEKERIEQSGGILEVIESMIPNPKKQPEVVESPVVIDIDENVVVEAKPDDVPTPAPAKRKAGRPKKVFQ